MARALVLAAQGVQHSAMLAPYQCYGWTSALLERGSKALGVDVRGK